jgi:glucokinase
LLIAGDIGGTKTELAIFSKEGGPHFPLAQERFHSADYPSLEAIVKDFLTKTKTTVNCACFAIAGPVIDGRVKTTNLPWVMEETGLAQALNLAPHAVHLINDLEAIARSIPVLRPNDIETINVGEEIPKGAIAVIAPGTGLGESFLTWDSSCYIAHSSEGGHADFAPTDDGQIRLLQYMRTKFDHVSFEHVCSGIGIPYIYSYLSEVERMVESPEVHELISKANDASVVIIEHAVGSEHPSKLCCKTIDMFVSILASESGNLALKVLATGGVYMAGGVASNLLPALHGPAFMQSFIRKGRFAELMAKIPIHVIVSMAGLTGAAVSGLESAK